MFGWHLHVRSRPFSLVCFVCSVCTFLSEAVRFLCFVCSVGTFLSEAVRFLGVVLCVRLAPSGQKPSKARFLGFFLCVWLAPSCQKPSVFSVCFLCSFGPFRSEGVHFLGFVLCVRLASTCTAEADSMENYIQRPGALCIFIQPRSIAASAN